MKRKPMEPTAVTRILAAAAALLLAAGCTWPLHRAAGIGTAVSWSRIPGWPQDHHAEAWPALLRSCERLEQVEPVWETLCAEARRLEAPSDAEARRFFETWFVPHRLTGRWGQRTALVTGYYEPLLNGSTRPDGRFRYPLYARPPDLVSIELGSLIPELRGRRLRGRLIGRRVLPYYSRAEIEGGDNPLAGHELLWVDDPVALFFLHIQGSGRVRLQDGRTVGVGYADQNGYPYTSIGRKLVEMGELEPDEVSLFTIRAWLHRHRERAAALMQANASYVFFRLRESGDTGPVGTLNVVLTPERSIAVDPAFVPLGVPVWLDTRLPGHGGRYRRLVFAQDTGGAIKGSLRADLFWGHGPRAERMAGEMKEEGRLYVLLPVGQTKKAPK